MRRTWLVFLGLVAVIVVGVVIAVVVLRSNDGDKGNPSAASWASSVCTYIDDWRTSVTSLADISGGTLTKDSLREKLSDGRKATDELVTNLEDLGAPDVQAGADVKARLNADADGLRSSYDALSTSAQSALDAPSATQFLAALAALARPYSDLVTRISTTLDDLRNANVSADARTELQQAFDDADSCKKLRSQD